MTTNSLEDLAKLRIAVGCLGERESHHWWESNFFSGASKAFLTPVFTRTVVLAQYHGVTEAAARVHDEHIGIGQVYHLFRLPGEIEQGIDQYVSDSRESSDLTNVASASIGFLKAFGAAATGEGKAKTGPTRVADVSALTLDESWREVAAYYVRAFETSSRVYPYFSRGK